MSQHSQKFQASSMLTLATLLAVAGQALAQASTPPASQPKPATSASPAAASKPAAKSEPLLNPGQISAATEPGAFREDRGPFSFALEADAQIDFSADLRDSLGSVSVYRVSPGASVGYAINDRIRIGADFNTEFSWYDFDNATGIIPGTAEPFDSTSSYTLSPSIGIGLDERWSVRAAGIFNWSQEGSGPDSEGFTGGGLGVVRYKFSDSFALSGGLLATSRLEDDARIIPLIGVEWQINDMLRFETRGLGAELSAKVHPAFQVFLDGGYNSREFRLEDTNLLPEGIIRDRRAQVGVGVRWLPTQYVQISLKGGAVVWSEFRVDDRFGNELRTIEADPTGFIGLMGVIRF